MFYMKFKILENTFYSQIYRVQVKIKKSSLPCKLGIRIKKKKKKTFQVNRLESGKKSTLATSFIVF